MQAMGLWLNKPKLLLQASGLSMSNGKRHALDALEWL